MSSRPYVLADTPWQTVRATRYDVAVLPWGATEAHNFHLPYGTDIIEAQVIAAESARLAWEEDAKVVALPPIPFGVNTGQLDIPLTINMNPGTQMSVLSDVIASLEHAGIEKLVILNSHGGNDFRQMIRELQPVYDVFVCTVNWWVLADPRSIFDDPGDHAGELETSLLMHLTPDLVLPLSQAGPGKARPWRIRALREGWAWAPREWTSVTDDTGVGDPSTATAEKGARYFAAVTRQIADFLVELAAADPTDLYETRR